MRYGSAEDRSRLAAGPEPELLVFHQGRGAEPKRPGGRFSWLNAYTIAGQGEAPILGAVWVQPMSAELKLSCDLPFGASLLDLMQSDLEEALRQETEHDVP